LLFTENAGRTTVTNTVRYANQQTRDGVLKSPMEQGVGASYDRLEQIVSQEVAA
jgi:hypothetical protein